MYQTFDRTLLEKMSRNTYVYQCHVIDFILDVSPMYLKVYFAMDHSISEGLESSLHIFFFLFFSFGNELLPQISTKVLKLPFSKYNASVLIVYVCI